MAELPGSMKAISGIQRSLAGLQRVLKGVETQVTVVGMASVGIVGDAIATEDIHALSAIYPELRFEHVGSEWQERYARHIQMLIVAVDASAPSEIEKAVLRLKERPPSLQIAIVVRNASVAVTRALAHAGAADVLPAPVSDAALALSIERLLSNRTQERSLPHKPGQIAALLKAGGGVGATALGVQAAMLLALRAGESLRICFADLDLQFGAAATYLDMPEAITVTDAMAAGEHLAEAQWVSALTAHSSGLRLLAGPRELTGLDALTPALVDALLTGLRRDFALSILDLPSVWTAWTNRGLQLVDRIVLVTRLSVAHVQLVRRQLSVLALQKLDELPLTLVCNAVTPDQQRTLSVKEAERAIGRHFDIVLPTDERVMVAATNEGRALAAVRRGTKIEAGIAALANEMAADALVGMAAFRMPGK